MNRSFTKDRRTRKGRYGNTSHGRGIGYKHPEMYVKSIIKKIKLQQIKNDF